MFNYFLPAILFDFFAEGLKPIFWYSFLIDEKGPITIGVVADRGEAQISFNFFYV